MNKLTSIKLKNPDGTYSDQIQISVSAENVVYDETHNVSEKILTLNDNIGNLSELKTNKKNSLIAAINNLSDSVDSIENIESTAVQQSYYDEITYSIEKLNGVDVYIVNIPLKDSNNQLIDIYVGYDANLSPLEYAQKNGTTLTTNNCISMKPVDNSSSLLGNIIGAGTVLKSQNITKELVSKGVGYLTFSSNRQVIKTYPITTTLATLQADSDVYNCMTYYCQLAKNNSLLDITGIVSNEGNEFATKEDGVGMFIGVKADKTILIAGNDGRTEINTGLNPLTVAQFLLNKGCTDVWLMDGGGSSNITVRGSKLNRNYDENGTKDRKISYTFNVKKPTALQGVTDVFAKIGEEKQNLIKQIYPAINNLIKKDQNPEKDLKTIIPDKENLLYKFDWGAYYCETDSTYGYKPVDNDSYYLGMEQIAYADKPIILIKKIPQMSNNDNSIRPVVLVFQKDSNNKFTGLKTVRALTSNTVAASVIPGEYYWIGFKNYDNPHTLTLSEIGSEWEIFSTESQYILGASQTSDYPIKGGTGLVFTKIQLAEEDILVTSDDWFRYRVTYKTYPDDGLRMLPSSSPIYANNGNTDFIIPKGTYYRVLFVEYNEQGAIKYDTFDKYLQILKHVKLVPLRPLNNYNYINNATDIIGVHSLVANLAKRLDILQKQNSINTIPSYYQSYIEDKVTTINDLRPETGEQFIFITDIHIGGYETRGGNAMHSHALINYICQNTPIKKVFNGGDLLNNDSHYSLQRSLDRIRTAISYVQPDTLAEQYYILGNHDCGRDNVDSAEYAPKHIPLDVLAREAGVYSIAHKVNYESLQAEASSFQYYFDNDKQKIHYIILTYGWQTNWTTERSNIDIWGFLVKALLATPKDYSVIILNHMSGYDDSVNDGVAIVGNFKTYLYNTIDAYNNKTSYTIGSQTANFSQNHGGKVLCVIAGHQHKDLTLSTTGGIPIFVTSTDNMGGRKVNGAYVNGVYTNGNPGTPSVAGTVNEQAFDVFTINTTTKTINITRIGQGEDRSFTYS